MGVFIILFTILNCRLWGLQIVNGQKYAQNYELKITKTVREKIRGASYTTVTEKFWHTISWYIQLR